MKVIFAGLSSDFDAVLTLASFSSETCPFQKIVDVLLEFEICQTRMVRDVPMHAHMVEASITTLTELDCGGRSTSSSRGRGFRPRTQCQICGCYGHLA